jgi:DNA polymerase III delta prime subunit
MNTQAYHTSQEHIKDLTALLDLMIYKLFLQEESAQKQGVNKYKGLGITPDDVRGALGMGNSLMTSDAELSVQMQIDEARDRLQERVRLTKEKTSCQLKFEEVSERFGLSAVERWLLLLGLSVHLDPKYFKVFGYLNDNMLRKRPTAGIMARMMGSDQGLRMEIISRLSGEHHFTRYILSRTLKLDQSANLFDRDLIINRRIESYILGADYFDPDIAHISRYVPANSTLDPLIGTEKILNSLGRVMDNYYNRGSVVEEAVFIQLVGDQGSGRKHLIQHFAKSIGRGIFIADLKGIGQDIALKDALQAIVREAVLRGAMIVLDGLKEFADNRTSPQEVYELFFEEMKQFVEPVFILAESPIKAMVKGRERTVTRMQIPQPTYDERLILWQYYAESIGVKNLDLQDLANKFLFTPLQIKGSLIDYRSKHLVQENAAYTIYKACAEQIENALNKKASLVEAVYKWDDIVLPEEPRELLREVCNQVRFRHEVMEGWGFKDKMPYGRGISVVCSGPPGTGKTMSAQVIAGELNLELYKIDLSQIISKYIGETEKNLNGIFEEAKKSNAVLFFDEADALFGKRTNVNESKDRYANIEVSYLLQKIEEYDGITILATNYLNNIDKAFLRRISYIVTFPFPDRQARKEIWIKSIPESCPIGPDVDFDFLAEVFEIAGGNIKNVVLNSAYMAASNSTTINMRFIIRSVRYELYKMDKLLLKEDLREFAYLMDERH